jgi:WD40 repeat protein
MSVSSTAERQLTHAPCGHILTNTGVWSPDGKWIVYDTRSDRAGEVFDGRTIEAVHVRSGEVRTIYTARNGACCGVATFCPTRKQVVFILGPEFPTDDWSYCAFHREGATVNWGSAEAVVRLDARDLTPPFTPGALRGGSHVHVFSSDGTWVSFTYEDHLLAQFPAPTALNDVNLRGVGVSVPIGPVRVRRDHPRNHDGEYFSVLVTRTTAHPAPGSDEIKRACEEGWIGTHGYLRPDGTRQRRALAFQGQAVTAKNETISEVFVVDLPEDLTNPGDGPLCGSTSRAPSPPRGCVQRRVTFTADRKFPGIQGPRHWLRSSPDGSQIAFLMKDDQGVVQIWLISPNGGTPRQLTHNSWSIASAFTWSADGQYLAHIMDNSVFITDSSTGTGTRLTIRSADDDAPRPEACVFSPDGRRIAYVRRVPRGAGVYNQIFSVELP